MDVCLVAQFPCLTDTITAQLIRLLFPKIIQKWIKNSWEQIFWKRLRLSIELLCYKHWQHKNFYRYEGRLSTAHIIVCRFYGLRVEIFGSGLFEKRDILLLGDGSRSTAKCYSTWPKVSTERCREAIQWTGKYSNLPLQGSLRVAVLNFDVVWYFGSFGRSWKAPQAYKSGISQLQTQCAIWNWA